jgi:anthranilate/para-aminobenzoate synthase component I
MPRIVHLHSSLQNTDWNYQSNSPILSLRCDSQSRITSLHDPTKVLNQWSDPLAALDWMSKNPGEKSTARWIGYISYDLGRLFEPMPTTAADDLRLPLFCLSLHEQSEPALVPAIAPPGFTPPPNSSLSKSDYLIRTARAIDYIRSGDVFQVNLSQRFTAELSLDPTQIWQYLMQHSPAQYGAYLNCGDHTVLSNSPELFLRLTPDRTITTRPIKGTRARRPGMAEELLQSVKDQAELNMIVDLERNDLGRICEIGSVKVTQPRTIEMHPTVYHGAATIEGKLREDVNFVDLLRATFPGGSITGAPKIRAMQIIEELEPVRRGPYCGAIGYLAADGSMQFNVAIRTMIAKGNHIHIPVGGGIVADSDPLAEYEETLTKAVAMFKALNIPV